MMSISVTHNLPLFGWTLMSGRGHESASSVLASRQSTAEMNPNDTHRNIERELETLYPTVFRMVSAMVWGSDLDPEDLTQDVFLKAYRKADTFNGESAMTTWLYRIARNTVIDAQRKRKFRNFFTGTRLEASEPNMDPANPETRYDEIETHEVQDMVRKAIASLPEPFRSILIWREIEDLPYAHICEITGEAEGTLKSRLFHAKKKLKDVLVSKGLHYEI
jgi:RNA polymerase sigma-70 factor, ECF subfamily